MIKIIAILSIWLIIIAGTKFINFSSKYFYMHKNLSFNDKINYFSNNFINKIIMKIDKKVLMIIIHKILLPILKINYIFMSVISAI